MVRVALLLLVVGCTVDRDGVIGPIAEPPPSVQVDSSPTRADVQVPRQDPDTGRPPMLEDAGRPDVLEAPPDASPPAPDSGWPECPPFMSATSCGERYPQSCHRFVGAGAPSFSCVVVIGGRVKGYWLTDCSMCPLGQDAGL